MSLQSGKYYLKEFPLLQDKTNEEPPTCYRKYKPGASYVGGCGTKGSKKMVAKSQISKSTRSSQRSSSSSAAAKAYVKAKAAKAQLVYAEKEAGVMKQKADIEASMLKQKADYDASLHLLQCQKAAAAAEAEATAYEEVESGELSQIGDEPMNTVKRTSVYVQQLFFSEQPAERETGELLEKKTSRMVISDTRPASPDAKNTT